MDLREVKWWEAGEDRITWSFVTCIKVKANCHCAFFNRAPRHEGVLGEWRYNSLTSALDRGEWSASRPSHFTPEERAPWYPLDRSLGGPQSRSGRGGGKKNFQPPPGIET
jgi:hypothetical protein